MAESANTNGEVNSTLPSSFAEQVQRKWVKAENPADVITCDTQQDVAIFCDSHLNCRVHTSPAAYDWKFTILTRGRHLRGVSLMLNEHRRHFVLQSVSRETTKIGVTDGQEWRDITPPVMIPMATSDDWNLQYIVSIGFVGSAYGTYRQNVIFDFGDYPVILERLCVDCVPADDRARLENATEYQLLQHPNRWTEKSMRIHRFASLFVPPKDTKEDLLEKIYPYPDAKTFFLTHDTLTEDRLTVTNYRGRLHELIAIEELARHEQIARYNVITQMRFLSNYVLASSGDGSTVAKYAPPGELFAQLPLCRNISDDTKCGRLFLRGCSSILFKIYSPYAQSVDVFEAHIEDKCINTIYARLSKQCVDTLNAVADTDVKVQVQFLLSRLTFCEWHRAIDALSDARLVFFDKDRHTANLECLLNSLNADVSNFDGGFERLTLPPLLNAEQKRAVAIMAAPLSIPLPPILLLGPFGTGKTFTIAQALCVLLTENPQHKILLCTHSNSAADIYVKEFFDPWYKATMCHRLKPVRIYYTRRARNTVHPTVQEYSLSDHFGNFREPVDDDLQNCGLIVTTLATSSSLACLNIEPTHIIIDEAAQALECEVLTALALASRETRLILAGDHMQLAPEVYSDLASERGLGVSLLERIYQMYPKDHPCMIHLCQNYRAHADIIEFTSEMFYHGKVKPGSKQLMQHPVFKPLTFCAVDGEEIQGMQSTGYAHSMEALELANRVAELKRTWPSDRWGQYGEGSIGVLAYYAEQVQRIRTELRKRKMFDVSVERVLNVQGKQFTAVFISIVRTRNCCRYSAETNTKDYGFLTNPRLLNTAITRAKCLVTVVGDPAALLTIGSCRALWKKYLEKADLHGIDRTTLMEYLANYCDNPRVTPLNPLAQEFVPRNPQPVCLLE